MPPRAEPNSDGVTLNSASPVTSELTANDHAQVVSDAYGPPPERTDGAQQSRAPQNRTISAELCADTIAEIIVHNESRKDKAAINWNDNGHGISVGMFQANQKLGQLPQLMKDMDREGNGEGHLILQNIFGSDLGTVLSDHKLRNAHIDKESKLGKEFATLAHNDVFQQVQTERFRDQILASQDLADAHGIHSSLGSAVVADLVNQYGLHGARRFLKAADKEGLSEEEKVKAILHKSKHAHSRGHRNDELMHLAKEKGLTCDLIIENSDNDLKT